MSNAYAANRRRVRYRLRLLRTGAPVLVLTEAWWVGRLPGYRRHGAPAGAGRHARDTAAYTLWGIRVDHAEVRTLTRDVGGYAHARTVTQVRLRFRGHRWAVLAVHPNPGRKGKAQTQNRRLMAELAAMMLAAERAGYTPVAAGDWNRRVGEAHDGDHPARLAQLLGGTWRLAGIDGVVTTARVAWLRNKGRPPGSNHPLLRIRVRPRGKR